MSADSSRRRTPSPRPTAIRHGRQRTSTVVASFFRTIGLVLAVALVSGVSIAAIATWDVRKDLTVVALEGDKTDVAPPDIAAIEGGVNLLLVGSDSRAGQGEAYGDETSNLNDVTMLLHISQDHSSASVVSFPRDLVVSIPECPDGEGGTSDAMSAQPINVTLLYGGLPCTVLTVEKLTGLEIPFAAEIQFNGVIEMSNAVGGVPVCVASPIDDDWTNTHLTAGTHQLAGMDALQFLRTRHGVGDGSDLGRISSQQVFLSSLVRTIKSSDTLTDVTKLYGLAKAAASNMQVSTRLSSPDTMVSIAVALKDIPLEKIGFYAYPGTTGGSGVYSGKVQPNVLDAEAMFAAIRADQPIVAEAGNTGLGAEVDPNALPLASDAPADPGAGESAAVESDAAADLTQAGQAGSAATVLPKSITGQSAAEYTCTKGFDY
ncbi:transcriptional attenuator, LytR family [Agreia bicolorata]|uniref:Transcriptional attenuator, LytR family n=1 Tax=Agreia bicolorata TaxID=110935 RepID=A0A1T4WUQ9_9MICO|nr:LCP family protein [Agreia bicolorata]SKA80588.1 transcriptional attenuator, LytR family [Agreia bicolorata]